MSHNYVTSPKCEVKGRICEVSLGQRGGSSYGEGGKGMRNCSPATSQILGSPGSGFNLLFLYSCYYGMYHGYANSIYNLKQLSFQRYVKS